MKTTQKKALTVTLVLAGFCLTFLAGKWSGRLQEEMDTEASYPWQLHEQIGRANITCDKLLAPGINGDFFVDPIDKGNVLLIANYNPVKEMVTASILDTDGRYATDSWPLECK